MTSSSSAAVLPVSPASPPRCNSAARRTVSTKGQADHRTRPADQQNAIERFCSAEQLEPERMTMLLADFPDVSEGGVGRKRADLTLLRAERTGAEMPIADLCELVEAGLDDPWNRTFAERLATHQRRLAAPEADLAKLERQVKSRQRRITPQIVDDAAHITGQRLRGDDRAFRKHISKP